MFLRYTFNRPPSHSSSHPLSSRHACLAVILLARIRHCTTTPVNVDSLLCPFIQPIHSSTTPSPSRKHGTSLHIISQPLPPLPIPILFRPTCAAKRGLRVQAGGGHVLLGRLVHRPILLQSSVALPLDSIVTLLTTPTSPPSASSSFSLSLPPSLPPSFPLSVLLPPQIC